MMNEYVEVRNLAEGQIKMMEMLPLESDYKRGFTDAMGVMLAYVSHRIDDYVSKNEVN